MSKLLRRAGLAAALCLIGSLPALAQETASPELIAAAKKEGTVVIYMHPTSDFEKKLFRDFESKYGVKVEVWQSRGSELTQRVNAELAGNHLLGDVVQSGLSILGGFSKALEPTGPLPQAGHIRKDAQGTDLMVPVYLQTYGYLINTDLVPAAERPKSWADLADPKWKGKILADDPRTVGAGFQAFQQIWFYYGKEMVTKIAAQKPVIDRDLGNAEQRVARGEYSVYMPMLYTDTANLDGLPIYSVVPTEGSLYAVIADAVLKSPRHPNAARLWISYQLEHDVQLAYGTQGNVPSIEGVAEQVTGPTARFSQSKLIGPPGTVEQQAETIAFAKQLYGN